MKKTLSFLLLLCSMTVLCAQTGIKVRYQDVDYSNGDTLHVALAADESHCGLVFYNSTGSRLEGVVVTIDSIYLQGVTISGLCTGEQCIPGLTSNPFSIDSRGIYDEFSFYLSIATQGANLASMYKMRVGNETVADTVMIHFYVPSTIGIPATPRLAAVNVYPNPAMGYVNVAGDLRSSDNLVVYDMQGREVLRRQVGTGHGIGLGNLTPGVYVYRLCGAEGATPLQKLVVK